MASRVEQGRLRAAAAKRAATIAAIGAFVAAGVLVRETVPGTTAAHGTQASQLAPPARIASELGAGAIAPAGGAAQVQSSTS